MLFKANGGVKVRITTSAAGIEETRTVDTHRAAGIRVKGVEQPKESINGSKLQIITADVPYTATNKETGEVENRVMRGAKISIFDDVDPKLFGAVKAGDQLVLDYRVRNLRGRLFNAYRFRVLEGENVTVTKTQIVEG